MRQALRDVAEADNVSEDRTGKEVARWLTEILDESHAEVAELLEVSPRTLQRWLSTEDSAEPRGSDAARLWVIARVVNQLRHSLSGPGAMRWFFVPHPDLKDGVPADLVADPHATETLLRLAAATRVSVAT
jgi:hypothetical protein